MSRPSSTRAAGTQFATLKPRIRHVSQNVVKKRWKKLSVGTQEDVRDLFSAFKRSSRPSVDGRRKNASSSEDCINEVTDKLVERLPRMPFPPSTHDETFDLELTLHRIRQGEGQLTANLHSMNLLRAQIKREERLLEQDRREAAQLERNFKASEVIRSQRTKTLHKVAHDIPIFKLDIVEMRNGNTTTLRLEDPASPVSVATLTSDPDVGALLGQLRNHLESIRSNASSMYAVAEAINGTSHEINGL